MNMFGGPLQTIERVAWVAAVLACLNGVAGDAQATPTTLDEFRADVVATFDGVTGPDIRDLIRLGFHDCTSDACDGCIDLTDEGNNGLAPAVNALEPICDTHSIDYADCYAAAASYATEESSANVASMPLFFGRTSTDTCVGLGNFPLGEEGVDATFNYFNNVFDFTRRETVAIMGAHSLGECIIENSGYDGDWDATVEVLDNNFYANMLEPLAEWTAEQTTAGLWQWRNLNNEMMLNSDMAMIFDPFDGTDASGEPTCIWEECEASAGLTISEEFAADNDLFIAEFSAAFVKMLVKGYDMCTLEITNPGTIIPDDCGILIDAIIVEEE